MSRLTVHQFAKLYDSKISTEVGADLRQKERSERKAQAKAARAEQLKRGRELSGTRYERAQIFKELRHSQGDEVTLDRIFAELTLTTNGHQDQ